MNQHLRIAYPSLFCAVMAIAAGCGEDPKPACADDEDGCDPQGPNEDDEKGGSTRRDSGANGGKPDGGGGNDTRRDAATGKDASNAGDKGLGLPCDVAPLVEKYCGTCHGEEPAFGAPVSLTAPADFKAQSPSEDRMVVSAVAKRRINTKDPIDKMPPTTSKQPSAAELALLNDWLSAGAPAGDGECQAPASDAGVPDGSSGTVDAGDPSKDPNLTCYKLLAHNGDGKTPFSVGVARDAYFNLTFAAPWKGTAYARVIRPVVDNTKVIHHWLLFEDNVPGLPGAPTRGTGAHPAGQLIMGWAPGGEPNDFRTHEDDLGFELPGNTTYTIEFHYNSSDAAAKDASGAEICVTTTKPKNIVGLSWLGNDNFLFPSTTWTGTCRHTSRQPIHIVGVNPHMHLQGRHIKAVINRAGGKQETLQDSDFNFDYQISYNKDVTLNPGDTITTTCTFAQPMTFGESTNAEMCYLFTLAYPKGALSDGLPVGSVAHGGSSCLGQ